MSVLVNIICRDGVRYDCLLPWLSSRFAHGGVYVIRLSSVGDLRIYTDIVTSNLMLGDIHVSMTVLLPMAWISPLVEGLHIFGRNGRVTMTSVFQRVILLMSTMLQALVVLLQGFFSLCADFTFCQVGERLIVVLIVLQIPSDSIAHENVSFPDIDSRIVRCRTVI